MYDMVHFAYFAFFQSTYKTFVNNFLNIKDIETIHV